MGGRPCRILIRVRRGQNFDSGPNVLYAIQYTYLLPARMYTYYVRILKARPDPVNLLKYISSIAPYSTGTDR